jgi:ABC-2 type transport system permease protein
MKAYINLVRSGLKAFVRDRAGLFWSFFFPLFFIFIFGSIFGNKEAAKDLRIPVDLVLQDKSPAVAWVTKALSHRPLDVKQVDDLQKAKLDLGKGEVKAVIVFPDGFADKMQAGKTTDVTIYTDPSQQQMSAMAGGIIQQYIVEMDKHMSNTPTLLKPVLASVTATKKDEQGGINFLLPGILAMTVMQLGLFTAIPLINMREKGILKRFRATPLPRSTLVASQVTQRLVIGVIQTLTIITVGVLAFKFEMKGSWPVLLALVIFGVLTFISIGAVLASIAKTQESGISLVQLVNFPMMFLSGLFFPIEILPKFFGPVVKIMPATYLADMLRHVMVNAPLAHPVTTDLAVLGGWLIGGLFIASRMFKWE